MNGVQENVAKDLGFENPEQLNDMETKKAYYRKKNDEYAVSKGYKDFDDLMANSKFGLKKDPE